MDCCKQHKDSSGVYSLSFDDVLQDLQSRNEQRNTVKIIFNKLAEHSLTRQIKYQIETNK